MLDTINELKKKVLGRRKKVFTSSLDDIKAGNVQINAGNESFTAAFIRGTIRRAKDPGQAAAEYARILKPKSPALVIIRVGSTFTKTDAASLLEPYFIIDSKVTIAELPGKKLIGFVCRKK